MSLKAGRVGVAPSEVDSNGKLKGGSSDAYTKQQSDSRFAKKTSLGGLEFREEDGVAQYKKSNGEWVNFSSGDEWDTIWENSSPTTTSGFTINTDLTDYKLLKITCTYEANKVSVEHSHGSIIIDISSLTDDNSVKAGLCQAPWGLNNDIVAGRPTKIMRKSITFYNGYLFPSGTYNRSDSVFCLPIKIEGIK